MSTTVLWALLILSLVHVASVNSLKKQVPKLSTLEMERLCNNLENSNSLFNPFRCVSKDVKSDQRNIDLGKAGRDFIKYSSVKQSAKDLPPVILVPGFAGSGLQAKLHKQNSSWVCYDTTDWYRIWLSLEEFLYEECWLDNFHLTYNPHNNTYSNPTGVNIRAIDWGGVKGIDYLDYLFGYGVPYTSVYSYLVASFQEAGYVANHNLRGAPFDFRLPASAHKQHLYPRLQRLIEETYATNANKSVYIITHSMGGPTFLYFLNMMSQEWKDKYIAAFLPIAAPWGGAPKGLRALISGDNLGITFFGFSLVNRLKFRKVARTAGGLISLLPDSLYWPQDQVFVTTPKWNYTVRDFDKLLRDVGANVSAEIYPNVQWMLPTLIPPRVPTYCVYGTNTSTEISYVYSNNYDDEPVSIGYSNNGDGTVPMQSLKLCNAWKHDQKERVVTHEFEHLEHQTIIQDERVIHYLLNIITSGTS